VSSVPSPSDLTGAKAPRERALTDAEEINRLRLVLLRVARQIRANSPSGVTPSQLAVIATLVRHGPCTIGQIAEFERVQPPSVSKIVEGLTAVGLVERERDPDDRRRVVITLSQQGKAFVERTRTESVSWLATRLAHLNESELEAVAEAVPLFERLLGHED
jgi:DNA-binding MarR family transcriptional regulator